MIPVEVDDDGLGSALIARMTNGNWRLTENSTLGGAHLQAIIALQEQHNQLGANK